MDPPIAVESVWRRVPFTQNSMPSVFQTSRYVFCVPTSEAPRGASTKPAAVVQTRAKTCVPSAVVLNIAAGGASKATLPDASPTFWNGVAPKVATNSIWVPGV